MWRLENAVNEIEDRTMMYMAGVTDIGIDLIDSCNDLLIFLDDIEDENKRMNVREWALNINNNLPFLIQQNSILDEHGLEMIFSVKQIQKIMGYDNIR